MLLCRPLPRLPLPLRRASPAAFPPDPEGRLNTLLPRLVFCGVNGLGLAFAAYRINLMGLLPTHLSDWVSSIQAPQVGRAGGPGWALARILVSHWLSLCLASL